MPEVAEVVEVPPARLLLDEGAFWPLPGDEDLPLPAVAVTVGPPLPPLLLAALLLLL